MTLVVRGIAPEKRKHKRIPSPEVPVPASSFCLLCDRVIPSRIPLNVDFPDRKGFLRSRHHSGSFVVAAGRFQLLSLIYDNVMGLDLVPCGTDRPSSLGYFVPAVFPQVLRIRVMVPAGTSIEKLLTGLFAAVPAVYVLCVIELLQDPVIPALLLEDDRMCPVLWMEISHRVSVIHMAFYDIQCPALQLCLCPVRNPYVRIRESFSDGLVHHPPDGCHERRSLEAFYCRFPVPEFPSRFMVLRGMTLVTDRNEIPHPVGSSLAPVYDMMDVKDHTIVYHLPAALAGVIITGKDCLQ